ncbi:MAG: hypothetical protein AAB262_15615 [Elusimicrobiota bacterium]
MTYPALALLLCLAAPYASALDWPEAPAPARLRFLESYVGTPGDGPGHGLGKVLMFLLGINGRAADARRLRAPTGIFARGGVVYVADPGARGVLRYDEAKRKADWLPKGRGTRLVSPVAVVVAPDGRIFVADSALGKVLILDAEGRPSGELRGDPEGLGRPAALALAEGRVFVSDVRGHRVAAYGLDGGFLYSFGRRGTRPGEFNFPTYLWFDAAAKRLWVCDSGNFRLQILDLEGKPLAAFGENGDRPGHLARPRGLALDSDGNVYSVDGAMEALQIFDQAGRLLLFVGREGAEPGEFSLPGGVFVDEKDRVLVADTFNARVQVFQYLKEKQP